MFELSKTSYGTMLGNLGRCTCRLSNDTADLKVTLWTHALYQVSF